MRSGPLGWTRNGNGPGEARCPAFDGTQILGTDAGKAGGLPVADRCVLPFLIAARAACQTGDARPLFAEGLCSSYEAFLHTRSEISTGSGDIRPILDEDEDSPWISGHRPGPADWCLDTLERLLPLSGAADCSQHPKLKATVERTVKLWESGEKVLVFCHYIATGRALRQYISAAIHERICSLGASKLACNMDGVPAELERIGQRFFDEDSPLRRACDDGVGRILADFDSLEPWAADLLQAVRRNVRTPSCLVRHFPLERDRMDGDAMEQALETRDASGLSLRALIRDFFDFLDVRCGEAEREQYIDAVQRIQTGSHAGIDLQSDYSQDELADQRTGQLLPNVRLVNGSTRTETRQRLMLAFNTPFYPEVLIASSVMAEGVDLHLNCRHVIHHDLSWNPSCLEQRTGRVDRIGAKAERAGDSIQVYLPYIGETQHEKMYRVVMDRERWFKVVMGERMGLDAHTTERLARRLIVPKRLADELALNLAVWRPYGPDGR